MNEKSRLNCEINYQPAFLETDQANDLFDFLVEYYPLTDCTLALGGNLIKTGFGKVMFMDQDLYTSNALPQERWGRISPWCKPLVAVRDLILQHTGVLFQTCVCIYYPDGNAGVDYHSDLPAFGDTDILASISLGAERVFQLRENKTGKVCNQLLGHGSLLVMGQNCQERYEHALPRNPECNSPRINLTFRKYGYG